jgi:glycerol-1-phosphatase
VASERPIDGRDVLLLDLDGVVYVGDRAVPHAAESLHRVTAAGVRIGYITNNASRRPAVVAEQLRGFDLEVDETQVVTSPQAAVRLLAERVPAGSRILVIGGDGLTWAVEGAGFEVVHSADDGPIAVVQGFAPELGWKDLAEASFALADPDRLWVATNTDWTIPVARGIAPGNGTLVSAVHSAVGRLPIVAGKPERAIFDAAVERFEAKSPLFVGDRIDTDIAGAVAAHMPSAFVFTGVHGTRELLSANEKSRPDWILADLRGLFDAYPATTVKRDGSRVGRAIARIDGQRLEVVRAGDAPIDLVRAACAAIWASDVSAYALQIPDAVLAATVVPRDTVAP